MKYLYNALFYLLIPFEVLRLYWRARRYPAYGKRISERFARSNLNVRDSIWIHAVSAGETLASVGLVSALRHALPNTPIVLTTTTPTGSALAQSIFKKSEVIHVYKPYDLPIVMRRFLRQINPKALILIEKELWPNTIALCAKHGIPVMLLNATLSQKSVEKYSRAPKFIQVMFKALSVVAAQTQADKKAFIRLGVSAEKITVSGNLKFDKPLPTFEASAQANIREALGEPVPTWLAASTHEGEEKIILKAHIKLLKTHPNARLILVPRHPERFNSVASLIEQTGLSYVRRSLGGECDAHTRVYLADTLGDLMLLYDAVDIAFVAGSFKPIGGHNILEPALLGKAILVGPHMENFKDMLETFLNADALIQVEDTTSLAQHIKQLFENPTRQQILGEHAKGCLDANRGALQVQFDLVMKSLGYSKN